LDLDDGGPSGTIWVDGVQKTAGRGGPNVGSLVQVGFGWRTYHEQGRAVDAYFDDIAISTTRVGCLP
jgi:hypothetical protein